MAYFFLTLQHSGILEFLAIAVAFVIAVCFSITIHEFSHAFAAYKFGDNTPKAQGRLTLNPAKHLTGFGILCFILIGFGWAKPVEVNPLNFRNYKKSMAIVSLAGIFANILCAFLFSGLFYFYFAFVDIEINLFLQFIYYILYFSFMINSSLAIFNLLPIYPLDGFNFIQTFLRSDNKFTSFMRRYGSFILLIVILSPIFDFIYALFVGGMLEVFQLFWGLFL